jgi:hypothetical protein
VSEGVSSRLATLVEEGAAGFDPVAIRLIQRLQERAPALPPKARERLLERAEAHLDDLDRRFRASRGEQRHWRRLIPAALAESVAPSSSERSEVEERRGAQVRRGLERAPYPAAAEQPSSERPSEIRLKTKQLTRSQYEETAAAAAAQLALLRAEDAIPELAGPYHPSETAARALRMMERLGRSYLYAQLRRFEGFAALSALEALDPPPAKKRRRKRKHSR